MSLNAPPAIEPTAAITASPAGRPTQGRRGQGARLLRWTFIAAIVGVFVLLLIGMLAFASADWLVDSGLGSAHITINGEPVDVHGALEGTGLDVFMGLGTAALVVVLVLFVGLPVLVLALGVVGLSVLGAGILAVVLSVALTLLLTLLATVSVGAMALSPLIFVALAAWGAWALWRLWARSRRPRVQSSVQPLNPPNPPAAGTDYPAAFDARR